MRLTKHHGLGNDFLVLLDVDGTHTVDGAVARAVCDRHRGIGADGLLHVTAGSATGGRATDVTMALFNADGGRAEMSGNGVSCLAQAVVVAGIAPGPVVTVATDAGVRRVTIATTSDDHLHRATVDMGAVKVEDDDLDWIESEVLRAAHVDVGNPHLVLHVPTLLTDEQLVATGEQVNELVPGGSNVELVVAGPEPGDLTMQVYERGVGLTEACGTGACAVAAAAAQWSLTGREVRVHQPGGTASIVVGATVEMTVPVVHVATIETTS